MERERTVSVLRIYGEELRRLVRLEIETAAPRSEELLSEAPGDPRFEAFLLACARAGEDPEELARAIREDRSLLELEMEVTKEALTTAPDPGPYDAISREASSGTPENRHVGAIGTREVGRRWRDSFW
jgi:hypothetical protein